MQQGAEIQRIDAYVFRCPIELPVATSFGIMRDRPAVFVRIEDRDGAFGWGEIFANWPAAGAEHRARLLTEDVAALVVGRSFDGPQDLFRTLSVETHTRAVQCGEPGPFRQVIAGLDIALWDLFARRAGKSLSRFLSADSAVSVPVYASGIHVQKAQPLIAAARGSGIKSFKVKVGFDLAADAATAIELFDDLRDGERLLADANQAWDVAAATRFLETLDGRPLGWLEEPIPVDAPQSDWAELARSSHVPLAGGENIAGEQDFESAISDAYLSVLQPDVAKWGGITGCAAVARAAIAAGRNYCPHFLGGGIGLQASAHLLAAVGGPGLLEIDVNPNPLREAIAPMSGSMKNGQWRIDEAPGLGMTQLPQDLDRYRTLAVSSTGS